MARAVPEAAADASGTLLVDERADGVSTRRSAR
jgi:hypothetical protein